MYSQFNKLLYGNVELSGRNTMDCLRINCFQNHFMSQLMGQSGAILEVVRYSALSRGK